jgi:hypothetical protein
MNEYLIWSFEHDAWWAPDRRGYTRDIEQAGVYTAQEAGAICCQSVWVEEIAVLKSVAEDIGPPVNDPYEGKR